MCPLSSSTWPWLGRSQVRPPVPDIGNGPDDSVDPLRGARDPCQRRAIPKPPTGERADVGTCSSRESDLRGHGLPLEATGTQGKDGLRLLLIHTTRTPRGKPRSRGPPSFLELPHSDRHPLGLPPRLERRDNREDCSEQVPPHVGPPILRRVDHQLLHRVELDAPLFQLLDRSDGSCETFLSRPTVQRPDK